MTERTSATASFGTFIALITKLWLLRAEISSFQSQLRSSAATLGVLHL